MGIVIGGDTPKKSTRKLIDLELVGQKYKIRPMKSATAMKFMGILTEDDQTLADQVGAIYALVDALFGQDAAGVKARLEDPEDALDFDHIAELMQALFGSEEQTGKNPTG